MRWYQHNFHTVFSHRLVFAIIPRLPKFLHPPIAACTALLFFVLLGKERAAVVANLRVILATRSRPRLLWSAWGVFYSFCDFMVAYCYVPRATHQQLRAMLTRAEYGGTMLDAALARGHGVILWTAHLGNWEFASRLLETHGRTIYIARMVERGSAVELMLRDMMVSERLRVIQINDNPLSGIEILQALRNNDIVAMQGDRAIGGAAEQFDFMGRPVAFPSGPFLLSALSGAPIIPGVVIREGWLRYRVMTGDLIEPAVAAGRATEVRPAMGQAISFLERAVRDYPRQWLNFYDFWNQPRGEAGTGGSHGRR
jgi:KDO2-lipid IV(A) lauroyltransferase